MTVVPNAYTLEKTARLSGLSAGQLREWAKTGFFQPHYESGLYSLRDIIALRTLGILRNERGISLQSLKRFKKWLDERYDQPWSELRFATYGSEVLLDAEGRLISGKKPGQYADVVPFPVERVELTVRKAAAKEATRSADQVGQVSKQNQVMGNATCIAGTRIRTSTIWEFHQAGYSVQKILAEYPRLTEDDVRAAIEEERSQQVA